jgi:hypothetical protein
MEEIITAARVYIASMAPRWHANYYIACNDSYLYISFCGHGTMTPHGRDSTYTIKRLSENWHINWTAFEQIDWLAVLGHQNHSGGAIDKYPYISRHFDIHLDPCYEGRFTIDLPSHQVKVYEYIDRINVALGAIEAHLANLANMRVVMAILPTTIMRAVLAFFFYN